MFVVRRARRRQPLSYRAYIAARLCLGVYSVAWCAALVWTYGFWEASIWSKLGVTVLLALLGPDAGTLLQSYRQYLEEWKRAFSDSKETGKSSYPETREET
ncbi:MAG TPA: hypothetical protein VNN77_20065 [candidate division Zixibacteria bacterium]|nr:hypothetical protein [candidate division Zixibacteria bacterium]